MGNRGKKPISTSVGFETLTLAMIQGSVTFSGNTIPPHFGFTMFFEEQNPHCLQTAAWATAGTLLFHLAASVIPFPELGWGWTVLAGRNRSPTSAASLHLNTNKEQEQTPSCQQRERLPSGSHCQLCSFSKATVDTAPSTSHPHKGGLHIDLSCCRPNRACQHNLQGNSLGK